MKIALLTNEYPPNVYGGAGVHVENLTRELAKTSGNSVKVICFGNQKVKKPNLSVTGVNPSCKFFAKDPRHNKFLDTMLKDIAMAGELSDSDAPSGFPAWAGLNGRVLPGRMQAHSSADFSRRIPCRGIDIVHCHTWYSHFAGLLVKQLQQVPLVLTTHSLEPHRPWKAEQLGSAYFASSWIEKTAYQNADGVVAVSKSMKDDVHKLYAVPHEKIRVIHNGIDPEYFKPVINPRILEKYKINKNIPYVLFVGRITRQKGIIHLVNAVKYINPGCQVVLCAGAPDTKEIEAEMKANVEKARKVSKNKIIWIPEMVPTHELIAIYSQAAVFVCPSVYEPFGIINLEAMACRIPVVASKVGGIPEVVVPGETGVLVPIKTKGAGNVEPANPDNFSRDLAHAVNKVLASKGKMKKMGDKARKRVIDNFSWKSIALKTVDFYKDILNKRVS